jgi:hypothetical protein
MPDYIYSPLQVNKDTTALARQYAYMRAAIQELESIKSELQLGRVSEDEALDLTDEAVVNLRKVLRKAKNIRVNLKMLDKKLTKFLREHF